MMRIWIGPDLPQRINDYDKNSRRRIANKRNSLRSIFYKRGNV